MPHVTAPNIAHIAWSKLKEAGFKGCVFDKARCLALRTQQPALACQPRSPPQLWVPSIDSLNRPR